MADVDWQDVRKRCVAAALARDGGALRPATPREIAEADEAAAVRRVKA